MARIRTIKPEFWTDEVIVTIPYQARLLFIGMWNFCDDHGVIEDSPHRIKLQIMPDDYDFDVEKNLDLLLATDLLEVMQNEAGHRIYRIRNWKKHQKVDNPSKSKIIIEDYRKLSIPFESRKMLGLKYGCVPGETKEAFCYFCGQEGKIHWFKTSKGKIGSWVYFSSLEIDHYIPERKGGQGVENNLILSCRRCNRSRCDKDAFEFFFKGGLSKAIEDYRKLSLEEERKGKEIKISEEVKNTSPLVDDLREKIENPPQEIDSCPHQDIIALYHKHLPMCPVVKIWNKKRRAHLKSRWTESPKHQTLGFWENFFTHVGKSDFLTGKVPAYGDRTQFIATLEWLIAPSNFAKVIEGNYHKNRK